MEKWVEIKKLNNLYSVSNLGRVKNNNTGRILKPRLHKKTGYMRITITYKKNMYYFELHRLVLSCFNEIDDIKNMEVNHINWDITDNKLENLEWVSKFDNLSKKIINTKSYKYFKKLIIKYGDDNLLNILEEINKKNPTLLY